MVEMARQYDIKHMLFEEHLSVSEVARITGHSRNTIRKYRDLPPQEKCKPRQRQSLVEKEGFDSLVKDWVYEDSLLPSGSKLKRSVRVMYETLVKLGFTGSYESLARYVRKLKEDHFVERRTYERLELGMDIGQMDFGTVLTVHEGKLIDVDLLILSLPHSNHPVVAAVPSQNQECVLYGLQQIFKRLGGVPRKIWCDNLKAVVVQPKKGDKPAVLTEQFEAFANYYGFKAVPCNPYAGNEKGNVEKKVGFIRDHYFCMEVPEMQSYEQLTEWLNDEIEKRDRETIHYEKGIPVMELFEEQKRGFLGLPAAYPIEKVVEYRTNKYREVRLDNHRVVIHKAAPSQKVRVVLDWKNYRCYSLDNRLLQEGQRPYFGEGQDIKWQQIFRDWLERPGCIEHSRWSKHLPAVIRDFLLETPDKAGKRERLKTLIELLNSYTLDLIEENLSDLLASAHPYSDSSLNVLVQYDHLSRGGGQSHAEAAS